MTYRYTGFKWVGNFVNGVARAHDDRTDKYGYIDVTGKWVVKPTFDDNMDFFKVYQTDGTTKYYGFVKKNGTWYAINEKYQVLESDVIPNMDREKTYGKEYSDPLLSNGYEVDGNGSTKDSLFVILAMKGENAFRQPYYGICNVNGKILVAPQAPTTSYGNAIHTAYYSGTVYDDCILMEQKTSVQFDVLRDIYDGTTGELLFSFANAQDGVDAFGVPYRFIRETSYGQGLFVAGDSYTGEDNDIMPKVGYMNKYGKMKIPAVFENATAFSNGYAWVKYNGA